VRDRERQREDAIVIAIRRHAEHQQRARVGAGAAAAAGGGGGGAVGEVRGFDRSMSPRGSGGASNSPHGGVKRKMDTAYGPETVEQWASTEVLTLHQSINLTKISVTLCTHFFSSPLMND